MTDASPRFALSFTDIHKRFGATRALDGLNLRVPAGSFFGLIGPNGAGKTTAFSLACGFLQPDGGERVRPSPVERPAGGAAAGRDAGARDPLSGTPAFLCPPAGPVRGGCPAA